MKKLILLLAVISVYGLGCSTTATFKLPPGSQLFVTDRAVTSGADDKAAQLVNWETSPFFWSSAGGAKYRLFDKNGNLIRSGKINTHFRVVSIFWPPFALIYWPMGLKGTYDMTRPGDGFTVEDDGQVPVAPAAAPKK